MPDALTPHADVAGRHVLGAASGPQPDPSAAAVAVPGVLDAFARAGADAVLIEPDPVSAGLLAAVGPWRPPVVGLPVGSALTRVVVPAACATALPFPSLWPATAVTAQDQVALRRDPEALAARVVASWRTRVVATAYAVHRNRPVDLVVCAADSVSRAVALVLGTEADVALVMLVDDDVPVDGDAWVVLESAAEVWAPTEDSARRWAAAHPRAATRVRAVDWTRPELLEAGILTGATA
jgi:hypothetical protein